MSTITMDQRMMSLVEANERRMGPAAFRAECRALGFRDAVLLAANVLVSDPERVEGMRVYRFLESVPFVGDVKVKKLLSQRQIWPLKRVRELTLRQRNELALVLSRYANGEKLV